MKLNNKNIPAILWALVIFGLCSMPGKAIPSFRWLELLSFDKFVHAAIFFVQQLLLMRWFYMQNFSFRLRKNFSLISLVMTVAYGGALELMQYYLFSQRSGDIGDFIANSFGAVCGALLFTRLKKLLKAV